MLNGVCTLLAPSKSFNSEPEGPVQANSYTPALGLPLWGASHEPTSQQAQQCHTWGSSGETQSMITPVGKKIKNLKADRTRAQLRASETQAQLSFPGLKPLADTGSPPSQGPHLSDTTLKTSKPDTTSSF